MKLKSKIKLLDFFKYGKFDCIKLGQRIDWILENFPEPDIQYKLGTNSEFDIFEYGSIELHFRDNILYLIFSDGWFNKFYGAKNIKIDKWIFKKMDELKLLNVLEKFNENEINYEKKEDNLNIKLKLESGIEITFENINNIKNLNKNNYEMSSFGLINYDLLK